MRCFDLRLITLIFTRNIYFLFVNHISSSIFIHFCGAQLRAESLLPNKYLSFVVRTFQKDTLWSFMYI